jgi:hypothetical protein
MENFKDPSGDLTSMRCKTRRPVDSPFPTLQRQFNTTAASPTTIIKFQLKPETRKIKESMTTTNKPLGCIGLTPNITS